jgi:hypothetical protein
MKMYVDLVQFRHQQFIEEVGWVATYDYGT